MPCSCCFCSLSNNEDKFYTDWEETFESFDQVLTHAASFSNRAALGNTAAGVQTSSMCMHGQAIQLHYSLRTLHDRGWPCMRMVIADGSAGEPAAWHLRLR